VNHRRHYSPRPIPHLCRLPTKLCLFPAYGRFVFGWLSRAGPALSRAIALRGCRLGGILVSVMAHSFTPHRDPAGIHDRLHIRLLSMRVLVISSDNWTYDAARNGYWRLYVNDGPGAAIREAGIEHRMPPRCAILVPAWVTFDSRCNREVDHLYMHFDIVGLSGPMVRQWFDRIFFLPPDPLTDHLCERVRAALKKGRHDDIATALFVKSAISLAVARLFELLNHPRHGGADGPNLGGLFQRHLAELTPVMPALQRIDNHLADPPVNAELAECCGMSEDHFIRTFRRCVGQTPARYALERRITYAAERLTFGDDSLKQIAIDSGFSNRFHFTRAFKSIIGIPPAQYRQRGRV